MNDILNDFASQDGTYLRLSVDDDGILSVQMAVRFGADADRSNANSLVVMGHGIIQALKQDQTEFVNLGVEFLQESSLKVEAYQEHGEDPVRVSEQPEGTPVATHVAPRRVN